MELGLLGAFAGGLLTLLSPCSVMVLPAFFSYAFASPTAVLGKTAVFYLGLITTLVPLGVLAGTVGAFVAEHREAVVTAAAVLVIALGLLMLSGLPLPFLSHHVAGGTTTASVYALGTVYGLAGVCAGPVLGTVLTFAAVSGDALAGGVALLVFAAGMAFPLLVLSLLWSRLPVVRTLVRPREVRLGRWRTTLSAVVGGGITVALGALLLATHGTASLGGGLGASAAVRIEGWTLDTAGAVPDAAVLAVVAVLAAVALVVMRRRARRAGRVARSGGE
ncbi:cytochrome c biogenesis protein CcdA [Rathayibacter tanaceti]|uniref:Cytochrome c biogenesis protein CcdA n=2 Tax=Rathayibacter tanaceti TaxID=1671680 RepID=A0AAE6RHU4_9MICO|nr:cytochrome c biogenesis protein CcdA [Rathayibacter tanaceti]QHC54422.1 cytochrome c biogenesis protein CcdA [Rathayibacter tanaceti]TCO35100.1 cytochrome c biogenesis protein CcdA [Rathayibacter tanaceti]